MRIGPHTWYSGAPEADGFKGHAAAGVLLVEIDAPGADPRVEQIPLGLYQWHRIEAGFFAGHDPVKVLEEALPMRVFLPTTAIHPASRQRQLSGQTGHRQTRLWTRPGGVACLISGHTKIRAAAPQVFLRDLYKVAGTWKSRSF